MKQIRCAIYTRKSSEEGLEQDFNSLDAQREACESYIKSQKHEGWVLVNKNYDDGGYSGGTMNRPAFQELLEDVQKGLIDAVIVYKVDRLTRSLMDFAKIVDIFDKKEVSFVSITQHFNTTSSMGRLTLNILLAFAQFEREVTGERIRDKFAASKKKGMWINGKPPMGYINNGGKLEIEPKSAEVVKHIFNKYLEIRTVPDLLDYLRKNNICTRSGKMFYKGHLYRLLKNKTYIGKIEHKEKVYDGLHERIIDDSVFEKAQNLLNTNALIRKNSANADSCSLLKGILFDDNGNYMSPSHSNKKGKKYRYYVSQAQIQHRIKDIGSVSKISAEEIENFVTSRVDDYIKNKDFLKEFLTPYPIEQQKMISEEIQKTTLDIHSIRHILHKVILSKSEVNMTLDRNSIANVIEYLIFNCPLPVSKKYDKDSLIDLNFKIRISSTTKSGSRLIIGDVREKVINKSLFDAIIKSFYYHKLMFENKMTQKQKASTYIKRIMQLRFLPKDIIIQILNGTQEPDLTLDKLYKLCNPI